MKIRCLSSVVRACGLVSLPVLSALPAAAIEDDHAGKMKAGLVLFEEEIAPILKEHCVRCHGGKKVKGDLDFATREGLLRGGSHGPAVIPGDGAGSFLYEVTAKLKEPFMPDTGDPLTEEQTDAIKRWIDLGAPYAGPLVENPREIEDPGKVTGADRDFWSFRPLAKDFPPQAGVDFFVDQKLKEAGLARSPQADPITLINRVTLSLTGLPPTPEEVDAFVADPSDEAWQAHIDRLLDSPHYGERWARHWMDLARYADSGGFEHDNDRPHAWPYRDFLIRAFNDNLPYDQFVRWQLAGDQLAPDEALAWQATGFLAAGVRNGQITEREGMPERYDSLDDWVNTTGNAFLALSLGCARCHDHKFDPIPTRDYYGMVAAFSEATAKNLPIPLEPTAEQEAERRAFEERRLAAQDALEAHEIDPSLAAPEGWWLAMKPAEVKANTSPADTHEDPELQSQATVKAIDETTYELVEINGGFDGFDFTFETDRDDLRGVAFEILPHPDNPNRAIGMEDLGRVGLNQVLIRTAEFQNGKWSSLRNVTLTDAAASTGGKKFHDLHIPDANGKKAPGWLIGAEEAKERVTTAVNWDPLPAAERRKFTVRLACQSQGGAGRQGYRMLRVKWQVGEERPDLALPGVAADRSVAFSDPKWRTLAAEAHRLKDQLAPMPSQTSFVVTEGGIPARLRSQSLDYWEEVHVLRRGAVTNRDGLATPGFLQVASKPGAHKIGEWMQPDSDKERAALARWITDSGRGAGHLAARVMVNRLWQHHFGRGIVATPSDFGAQGTPPTHPELLDWLAARLIESGWDIKAMHRLLLTSATFQQASEPRDEAAGLDPTNQWWWRFEPRRLEAEAIRDRMLAASGLLDKTLYGPGTLDESMTRRSLYFTVKRSKLIPSLVQLNWPDTLASLDKRSVTTVAPQALLMLNNPEIRRYAEALADRVAEERPERADQITRAYRLTIGRAPTDAELNVALGFIESQAASTGADEHAAFADLCQILFSLNEFFFLS